MIQEMVGDRLEIIWLSDLSFSSIDSLKTRH